MIRISLLLLVAVSFLGAEAINIPTMNFQLDAPDTPKQLVSSLNVLVILTLLFLAPSMVLVMTTFTRFVIVFSFLRHALGTQQVPPTQLLVMLAMILTFFVIHYACFIFLFLYIKNLKHLPRLIYSAIQCL